MISLPLAAATALVLGWMLRAYSQNAPLYRFRTLLAAELAGLMHSAFQVLLGLALFEMALFHVVSGAGARLALVDSLGGLMSALSSLAATLTIPGAAMLGILIVAFAALHLAGFATEHHPPDARLVRGLVRLVRGIGAYRSQIGRVKLAILIAGSVTFFGPVPGKVAEIAGGKLKWADAEIRGLQSAIEERAAIYALDQALRTRETPFPLDRLPPLGDVTVLLATDPVPSKALDLERLERDTAEPRPGRIGAAPDWQGPAGALTKARLEEGRHAVSGPVLARPETRGEIERINAEAEIYRAGLKQAAGLALDPARVPAVAGLINDIPLAAPIVSALAGALRGAILAAQGDRAEVPLEVLIAGRARITAWINGWSKSVAKELVPRLPTPDPEHARQFGELTADRTRADLATGPGAVQARAERLAQIELRSGPDEARLVRLRFDAVQTYARIWDLSPVGGRYPDEVYGVRKPGWEHEVRNIETYGLAEFLMWGHPGAAAPMLPEDAVGSLVVDAFRTLEGLGEAGAHAALNRLAPRLSGRLPELVRAMADLRPMRFGRASGLLGDTRFAAEASKARMEVETRVRVRAGR